MRCIVKTTVKEKHLEAAKDFANKILSTSGDYFANKRIVISKSKAEHDYMSGYITELYTAAYLRKKLPKYTIKEIPYGKVAKHQPDILIKGHNKKVPVWVKSSRDGNWIMDKNFDFKGLIALTRFYKYGEEWVYELNALLPHSKLTWDKPNNLNKAKYSQATYHYDLPKKLSVL